MANWTGKKYLDTFFDEGLDIDMGWTPTIERDKQLERLTPAVAIMELVRDHPGRIPESRGREARRADKLNAKRVQARLLTQLVQWYYVSTTTQRTVNTTAPANGNITNSVTTERDGTISEVRELIDAAKNEEQNKIAAAQLQWPQWWVSHKIQLTNCLRSAATHAKATSHVKAGNRICNRLGVEYNTLDEVLGNLPTDELQ